MDARIEIHRLAPKRILTTIAYMAGLIDTAFDAGLDLIERIAEADRTLAPRGDTLGRRARGTICRLLKPAESAARRLAIALSQGIVVKVVTVRKPIRLNRVGSPIRPEGRSPRPIDATQSEGNCVQNHSSSGFGTSGAPCAERNFPPPCGEGLRVGVNNRDTSVATAAPANEESGMADSSSTDAAGATRSASPARPVRITLPAPSIYLPKGSSTGAGILAAVPRRPTGNLPQRPTAIPTRLPIFDPAYRFPPRRKTVPSHRGPRIRFLDGPNRPLPRPHLPDDLVPIGRLHGRIEALARALDDLPSVALRHARWKARIDAQTALAKALDEAAKAGKLAEAAAAQASNFPEFRGALAASAANPASEMRFFRDLLARPRVQRNGRCVWRRISALKVGHPPGCRRTKPREVDDIATDAHRLAWDSMHRRE